MKLSVEEAYRSTLVTTPGWTWSVFWVVTLCGEEGGLSLRAELTDEMLRKAQLRKG